MEIHINTEEDLLEYYNKTLPYYKENNIPFTPIFSEDLKFTYVKYESNILIIK